jgi:hypothetical protein
MITLVTPVPTTIDEVLADLQEVDAQLGRRDGTRYFNRLYIDVTTRVRELAASGSLHAPAFITELDVNFAQAYFDALLRAEAGPAAAPPAWRPVFAARRDRRVAPIQLALAGMNAHINYDLPVQIARTAQAQGVALDAPTPQRDDFFRMSAVFEQAEDSAKRWLLTGLLHRLDRLFGHVDDTVAIWSTLRAREAAWSNAVILWHLRGDPVAADAFRDTLAHSTGAFGRGLVLPSALVGLGRLGDFLFGR